MNTDNSDQVIAVTAGDPAGIGQIFVLSYLITCGVIKLLFSQIHPF